MFNVGVPSIEFWLSICRGLKWSVCVTAYLITFG